MTWVNGFYNRRFVCMLHFIGLDNIQLGFHINWKLPNIEIHLPFCFIRLGWQAIYKKDSAFHSFGRRYRQS